jgi:RNA polymerase sigma-70 factor, ECF subfamily
MEARRVTEFETGADPVEAVTAVDEGSGALVGPERAALALVFQQHADGLVHGLVAAGYSDASDAVQEAFVQALVHWRRVCRYDDPLMWIRRVAINKARNQSRSRRRQAALAERISQRSPRVAAVPGTRDDDVAAAVTALPAQQRLAAALFYYSDLSVAQVATVMRVSEGTVKSHLHAARAKVAQALEGTS